MRRRQSSSTSNSATTVAQLHSPTRTHITKTYVAAGAPGKRGSCHLFRHTCDTLMLEGGADIRYVSEMLADAKLETTALYTRVSIAKLRAVHAATHPAGNHTAGADVRQLPAIPGRLG